MSFGQWLSQQRKLCKLSLEDLASKTSYSRGYIHRLEQDSPHGVTGALPQPSRKIVIELANALGVPISEALREAGYYYEEDHVITEDQERLIAYYGDMSATDKETVLSIAQTLWQKRRERELIKTKSTSKQEINDDL